MTFFSDAGIDSDIVSASYIEMFAKNNIETDVDLFSLGKEDLKAMGICSIGHVNRIFTCVSTEYC